MEYSTGGGDKFSRLNRISKESIARCVLAFGLLALPSHTLQDIVTILTYPPEYECKT